jgi:hypothetical protein
MQISIQSGSRFVRGMHSPLRAYRQLKNPFPFEDKLAVYRRAYSDKEWAAMRYIREHKPEMLNPAVKFTVRCDKHAITVHVKDFPSEHLPTIAPMDAEKCFDEDERAALWEWCTNERHFLDLEHFICRRLDRMMGHIVAAWSVGDLEHPRCNTVGQLARLWPEVVPFMPERWRDTIRLKCVKSRLPSGISERSPIMWLDPRSLSIAYINEVATFPEEVQQAYGELLRSANDLLHKLAMFPEIQPKPHTPELSSYSR